MLRAGQLGVHVPVKEMSRSHEKGGCTSRVVAQKISTPSTRIPPAVLATGILNPCWNWQLWDVEAQKKLRSMAGHSARVGCLSWNSFILSRYDSWNLLNLLFQRFERIVECWNILLQFDKKNMLFYKLTLFRHLGKRNTIKIVFSSAVQAKCSACWICVQCPGNVVQNISNESQQNFPINLFLVAAEVELFIITMFV